MLKFGFKLGIRGGGAASVVITPGFHIQTAIVNDLHPNKISISLRHESILFTDIALNLNALQISIGSHLVHPIDIEKHGHELLIVLPFAVDQNQIVVMNYDGTGDLEGSKYGVLPAIAGHIVDNQVHTTGVKATKVFTNPAAGQERHIYLEFNGEVSPHPTGWIVPNHNVSSMMTLTFDGNVHEIALVLSRAITPGETLDVEYTGLGTTIDVDTGYGIQPIELFNIPNNIT